MSTVYRIDEISKHTTESDLWFVRRGKVYNVTPFVDEHPGGLDTLLAVAGKDGTIDFDAVGHSQSAIEDLEKYYIGELHPEDVGKVPASSQAAQSNMMGFAIVLLVIAVCAFFILKP